MINKKLGCSRDEDGGPDAGGEVGTRSVATQNAHTFSRGELGAGLDEILRRLDNPASGQDGFMGNIHAALTKTVTHSGDKIDGQYGINNLDEFVDEAHSNPHFQAALNAVAVKGGTLWQRLVDVVRVLGLPVAHTDALTCVLEWGAALMAEPRNGKAGASTLYSQSAMKSVEANVRRGIAVMNQALLDKTTVHRAMSAPAWCGSISSGATPTKTKGVAHILEARQRKNGMTHAQAVYFLTHGRRHKRRRAPDLGGHDQQEAGCAKCLAHPVSGKVELNACPFCQFCTNRRLAGPERA